MATMSAREMLEKAFGSVVLGDTGAAGVLISEYEERRKSGGFAPTVELNGDVLKDLLVNFINTKEELVMSK